MVVCAWWLVQLGVQLLTWLPIAQPNMMVSIVLPPVVVLALSILFLGISSLVLSNRPHSTHVHVKDAHRPPYAAPAL